jgi:hypothetical protein
MLEELCELCYQWSCGEASTDDIRQWLDNNTDNDNLLKQAVKYKHFTGNPPLHF